MAEIALPANQMVLSRTSLLHQLTPLTRGHREGPALSSVLCTHTCVHVAHAVWLHVAVGREGPPVTPEQLVHVHAQLISWAPGMHAAGRPVLVFVT